LPTKCIHTFGTALTTGNNQLQKQHKLDGLCNAYSLSSLTYHYTHIHTMLVLKRLVSEMCCSSLNIPAIQSLKTYTRHKSMQRQKLKSKNNCFSTKASNSDDHKDYCKCISVPEELPASNIRAASLQMEIQLHQITWNHIPQGKILTEEIPIMSHRVFATIRNTQSIHFEFLVCVTLLRQFQSNTLALFRQQPITLDSTLKHAKCSTMPGSRYHKNLDASTTNLQSIEDKHADQPATIHATPYCIHVLPKSGYTH